MPILFDRAGNKIPYGTRIKSRVREFDTTDGVLPSWLESNVTPTFANPSTSAGQMSIDTTAVANNASYLRGKSAYDLATFQALQISVYGFYLALPTGTGSLVQFTMGFQNAAPGTASVRGARFLDDATGLPARFQTWTAGGVSTISHQADPGNPGSSFNADDLFYRVTSSSEAGRRRDFSLLLLPPTREMYLLEGDQSFGHWSVPGMVVAGGVLPYLGLTTRVASAASMKMEAVRLEYWT